ncbi:uncharacterized protein LOC141585301 [Saimiri boliviensis]|uniref:uncharacterized protein LOC141585301 n=1 Tax=Saimiri boliviensis TaxID=27679 RepID=UPI003D77BB59
MENRGLGPHAPAAAGDCRGGARGPPSGRGQQPGGHSPHCIAQRRGRAGGGRARGLEAGAGTERASRQPPAPAGLAARASPPGAPALRGRRAALPGRSPPHAGAPRRGVLTGGRRAESSPRPRAGGWKGGRGECGRGRGRGGLGPRGPPPRGFGRALLGAGPRGAGGLDGEHAAGAGGARCLERTAVRGHSRVSRRLGMVMFYRRRVKPSIRFPRMALPLNDRHPRLQARKEK